MAIDEFEFTNRVGIEMWKLLMTRAEEELKGVAAQDKLTMLMGAALIPVASVLGPPVASAPDRAAARQSMLGLASKWLCNLLEPAVNPDKP
jgi:hypothetical protein